MKGGGGPIQGHQEKKGGRGCHFTFGETFFTKSKNPREEHSRLKKEGEKKKEEGSVERFSI